MGEVFTIAGGKGGVGRTTTALNAGIALQMQGHDTAVVDADLGMTNLGGMIGVDHSPTIHDVLAGRAPLDEALVEGPEGVSLLLGSDRLEAFVDASPDNIQPLLEGMAPKFDAVIVDTSVGLCQETVVPVRAADLGILVTTPEDVAIEDTRKMIDLAETVDTGILGAVVTRAGQETNVPDIADELDVTVLAAVPDNPKAAQNEPVVVTKPDIYAAQAYETLAQKLGNYVEARATA